MIKSFYLFLKSHLDQKLHLDRHVGFTLIEVLIAMGILATLSILTAQSISRSLRGKQNIQTNIDTSSAFTSAIKIIERDIQMAFHFRDIHYEVSMKLQAPPQNAKNAKGQPIATPPAPTPGLSQNPPRPQQTTHFQGSEEKVDFVTLLQGRGYGQGLEGDQKEVSYYLDRCRKFTDPSKSSECLWRRLASFVDDNIERGGQARVLLEDVKTLNFRFYNQKQKRWVSTWNSQNQNKNAFPAAVEVSIEIEPNDSLLKFQSVIPIRYPNNQEVPTGVQPPPQS